MEWININEAVPENGMTVLVCGGNGISNPAVYDKENNSFYNSVWQDIRIYGVQFWTYLPEGPIAEEQYYCYCCNNRIHEWEDDEGFKQQEIKIPKNVATRDQGLQYLESKGAASYDKK